MKAFFTSLALVCACFLYAQTPNYATVKKSVMLMGTPFEISVLSLDEAVGEVYIQEAISEIQRIEALISSSNSNSETYLINKNAGIQPVAVSKELFSLIEKCNYISKITDGAFDITLAPLYAIWNINPEMKLLPSKGKIKEVLQVVGYKNIVLDKASQTVYLKNKGMKISFDAIAKGYAVDQAKALLVSKKVKAGMLNADGIVTTWGTKATGEKWIVGVLNPKGEEKLYSWLPILESSIVTLGSIDDYILIDDKKYSHIIHPKTGYPTKGIRMVSVFAQSAALANAVATAAFSMGRNASLLLLRQLGDADMIIIDDSSKLFKSAGVHLN